MDVVDTVGAGGSFTGGLLDGLARTDLLGADPPTQSEMQRARARA